MNDSVNKPKDFIRQIIEEDIHNNKRGGAVITRFPPEPNGFLHLGHAKSICLNFGIAKEYHGICNLRFDDTNPIKEEATFAEAIQEDVKWLGFDWGDRLYYASDYYDKLYDCAVDLIKQGKAFVCSLTMDQIRQTRGTLTEPGQESPYRNRSIEENFDLFQRMKAGEFKDGTHVLRAKIDMRAGNINMRDPIIYRIRHAHHHRTGDLWCLYPMYDFAHCISDAIEEITHSLCTLEFQDHRPLYDWYLDQVKLKCHPQQIEFSRLNLSHTITSKRKLKQLVEEGHVDGWDDPRMSTLIGARRRGYPPAAIRKLCELVGISKSDSVIDLSLLEECVRDELNIHAPRAMCVINPLRVVIENFSENTTTEIETARHPQDESLGKRKLRFSSVLYIERDDFMEDAPSAFHRLSPGKEVRLRNAYVIKCTQAIKDNAGNIIELRCSYDPDTLGKNPEGRKVKGVIHWVSAEHAIKAKVRLYDRLFTIPNPAADEDFQKHLNPNSLTIIEEAYLEPSLSTAQPEDSFQFERLGYFCADRNECKPGQLVFNRIVELRDVWKK